MRTVKMILCLVLAAVLLCGCAANPASTEPEIKKPTTDELLAEIAKLGTSPDDNYRVWYEILVGTYCDSNGDGVGDLNGIRSKLDELQALGINGIWLMPIHPSTSYHKYNVADYYAIDPEYGTMADFEALMADCQARGIKVILDLVINHTATNHKWFKELKDYLSFIPGDMDFLDPEECKYVEYYHLRTSSAAGYSKIPGTEFYYECQFSSEMPDLNLGSEAVRQEISDIMKFWMDKGVAGFRVDAAKEFYSGNTDKNVEVLSWLQKAAAAHDPNVYMVAEVWDSFQTITQYYKSGFTSIFNYPFGNSSGKIVNVVNNAGNSKVVSTYAGALATAHNSYSSANPNYIDAPFLSNHDVGRIAGFVNRDLLKAKMAGAMNILMGGSVVIYYGEEIGMICGGIDDPSFRAPMYWNARRDNGTTQPPEGCKLPASYPFGSLEEQKADDSSIYNYYRQAIAIRKALPVISHGVPTEVPALNKGCVSAQMKTWNDQKCIILMNIDKAGTTVDLSAYANWSVVASLSADGGEISRSGDTLTLPAFGIAILTPNT